MSGSSTCLVCMCVCVHVHVCMCVCMSLCVPVCSWVSTHCQVVEAARMVKEDRGGIQFRGLQ